MGPVQTLDQELKFTENYQDKAQKQEREALCLPFLFFSGVHLAIA